MSTKRTYKRRNTKRTKKTEKNRQQVHNKVGGGRLMDWFKGFISPPKSSLNKIMADLKKQNPEKIKQRETDEKNPYRFGYIENPYYDKVVPDWFNIELTLQPNEYFAINNISSGKKYDYTNDTGSDITIKSSAKVVEYNTSTMLTFTNDNTNPKTETIFEGDNSFPKLEIETNTKNNIIKTAEPVIGYQPGSH